jgi:uncharacterized protein (TIGR03118 family)
MWMYGSCLPALALCLGLSSGRGGYEREDLLSDGAVRTRNVDPNLVNPWGLASSPTGPFWIANEGTGTSTIAFANGSLVAKDVHVPANKSAHPTGLVFNGGDGFLVEKGHHSGPSRFLFVTLEGRVIGWSPDVDKHNALVVVDNGASGASYTGAALATVDGETFLYAANFAGGSIDVFDSRFEFAGRFTDEHVPDGYSPFGIAAIRGQIVATFVPRDPATGDEVPGAGHGLIDVFSPEGHLRSRLVTGGELNAPWGLVLSPNGFGPFSRHLLVGNFGDGRILAYALNGGFDGQLEDEDGDAIEIEGLWGLKFGNGGDGGDPEDLYFTAGIEDETHGVFGEIEFED